MNRLCEKNEKSHITSLNKYIGDGVTAPVLVHKMKKKSSHCSLSLSYELVFKALNISEQDFRKGKKGI